MDSPNNDETPEIKHIGADELNLAEACPKLQYIRTGPGLPPGIGGGAAPATEESGSGAPETGAVAETAAKTEEDPSS
ncbi:unnamed protein product [Moneuplotes crassus]|uniref:Uncharacterized protein n=1 Tax=Euplotes crassus TaxID=5936 RepID=A0AAD1Y9V3_EUPCR|nr:unnamed protein product [Moneuplotes crassus]